MIFFHLQNLKLNFHHLNHIHNTMVLLATISHTNHIHQLLQMHNPHQLYLTLLFIVEQMFMDF